MAKLTIKIEYEPEENEGHVLGQSTYYPDTSMTFNISAEGHWVTYIKSMATFIYGTYSYVPEDLKSFLDSYDS